MASEICAGLVQHCIPLQGDRCSLARLQTCLADRLVYWFCCDVSEGIHHLELLPAGQAKHVAPVNICCCLEAGANEDVVQYDGKVHARLVLVFQRATHLLLHGGAVVFRLLAVIRVCSRSVGS